MYVTVGGAQFVWAFLMAAFSASGGTNSPEQGLH